jgi:hypothetical protein
MSVIKGNLADGKKIKLTKGKFAIVDSEDFECLNQWKWSCDDNNYAVRHEQKSEYGNNPRRMIKMHSLINKTPKGSQTDHINRNTLDNRKLNLRISTFSQNQANTSIRKENTSGYKGVARYNDNKKYTNNKPWGARLIVKGKSFFRGMFQTKEEAAEAYNELAKKYFGEYANLNQIGGNI